MLPRLRVSAPRFETIDAQKIEETLVCMGHVLNFQRRPTPPELGQTARPA